MLLNYFFTIFLLPQYATRWRTFCFMKLSKRGCTFGTGLVSTWFNIYRPLTLKLVWGSSPSQYQLFLKWAYRKTTFDFVDMPLVQRTVCCHLAPITHSWETDPDIFFFSFSFTFFPNRKLRVNLVSDEKWTYIRLLFSLLS